MRKIGTIFCCLILVSGCAEHDPILPGERIPIFNTKNIKILNQKIENLPETVDVTTEEDCPYTQDSSNVIRNGDTKIFSGFPTNNAVESAQKPICKSGYVYAGLTTGEVIKIAPKSRKIIWIADVFRTSNMTGGASIVDIVAPLIVQDGYVYAGGLGDAFCKINAASGEKKWCTEISTALPFIVMGNAVFVTGTDNSLYAVRTSDGAIYWKTEIKEQNKPTYEKKVITVGNEKINAETGEKLSK